MGQENSNVEDQDMDYQYVMEVDHRLFGHSKIFKANKSPYTYIIEHVHRNTVKAQLQSTASLYMSFKGQKNFAKIVNLKIEQKVQLCSKIYQLAVLQNYYNFTLEDAIYTKKKLKCCFLETDLWYVLNCLVSVAKVYTQVQGNNYNHFSPEQIYITPQGFVRAYVVANFRNRKKIKINNPQQTPFSTPKKSISVDLSQHSSTGKKNKVKLTTAQNPEDLQQIGVIIICLICLKAKSHYVDSMNRLRKQVIHYEMQNNTDIKKYSHQLLSLLQRIFFPKSANNRVTYKDVEREIQAKNSQQNFIETNFIRVNQTYSPYENQQRKNTLEKIKIDSLMKNVEERLRVDRIESLSRPSKR